MLQVNTVWMSKMIVGGLLFLLIFWYIWFMAPVWFFVKIGCTVLLLWEAFVVANKQEGDTLTEALAELSGSLLLIPFGMGWVFGYLVGAGYMFDPVLNMGVGILMGHFFFSQGQRMMKKMVKAAEEVAEENVG